LDVAALVSCGVATGWGSAVERAGTRPGDVVAVIGVGGIGINAVQGARAVGARAVIAIDPVEFKREKALEFGATHTAASVDEARAIIAEVSRGRLCDRVVIAAGVVHGDLVGEALSITGKGSTCVLTGLAPMMERTATVPMFELTLWNKELKGTIYGSTNPRTAIPQLLARYEAGQLKLDELITRRYSLDEINVGYEDQLAGRILRGVITF
jgi:S-(hydroxymethyl)glutathione dehydrogenase/alcohol dehydrogenase